MKNSSLASHNLRLFLGGQALSLFGNSVQQVAITWLVYQATHSPVMLGWVSFAMSFPAALVCPFGGVLADRLNPHRLMLYVQVLAAVQGLGLAALVGINHISLPAITMLLALQGVLNGIDMPLRQMFLARLVNRDQVGQGVAFTSIIYDAARTIGPSAGGLALSFIGGWFCFGLNGAGHVCAAALYMLIVLPKTRAGAHASSFVQTFVEGVRYCASFRSARAILVLSAIISFAGSAVLAVLMPIIAGDVLKGGSKELGFLLSAMSVGAVIGGIYFSRKRPLVNVAKLITIGPALFGVCVIGFSASTVLSLSIVLVAIAGFGLMIMMASCNTVLLTVSHGGQHGRIISLFTVSYLATAPLGNMAAGYIAKSIGAPKTLLIAGVVCVVTALWFLLEIPRLKRLILAENSTPTSDSPAAAIAE